MRHKVEINYTVDSPLLKRNGNLHMNETFVGSEIDVYDHAVETMLALAATACDLSGITDDQKRDMVMAQATHEIKWLFDFPDPVKMFAVADAFIVGPSLGVYETEADAQEAIFTEAEWWAYETMMTEGPTDIVGGEGNWDWGKDYKVLMNDAFRSFEIYEVDVYLNC